MAEHAVLVYLKLSSEFGDDRERQAIHQLADRMAEAIDEAGVGEFDGDEFGDGRCTLYTYGPDADALFTAVESILHDIPVTSGGHVIKRYGEAMDSSAKEVRIEL